MPLKGLARARKLFDSGKYREVIRTLEPEVFRYRESFAFYYLLGASCLYDNDAGGALSYIKRAEQLKDDDVNTLLCLAAVYLRKNETENAIRTWLRVLEIEPGNRKAQKGLELVRKSNGPEKIIEFIDSGKLMTLLPARKTKIFSKIILIIAAVAVIVTAPALVIKYAPGLFQKKTRSGTEIYVLPEQQSLIDFSKTYQFTYSEKDIRRIFDKAKKLFINYKDNLATVELNRLLLSNASPEVKNTALMMKQHTEKPDYKDLPLADSFSYNDVSGDPRLYENCVIRWEGRAGSARMDKKTISFDFWVGNTSEFFGVVPVVLHFAADIRNGESLDLLGEVRVSADGKPIIEGIGIHKIIQK